MTEVKTLIRLHSTDESGLFECNFNEEIEVTEKSEIALHSTNFKIFNKALNVTSGDIGRFFIEIEEPTDPDGEAYEFELSIPSFEYTKMDVEDLLYELNDETNKVITDYIEQDAQGVGVVGSFETFIRGRQALWDLNNEGKIRFRIKAQHMIQLSLTTENTYKNMVFDNDYFSKTDAILSNNINQNYSYSKLRFIKGCGCARTQIYDFNDKGDGGASPNFMGLGLTTRDDKLKDGTIDLDDLDFALYTGNEIADGYRTRILVEGVSTETIHGGTTPLLLGTGDNRNDVMQIELVGNKMFFLIHRNNSTVVSLNAGEEITFDKTYYVVYFIAGLEANNKLNDVRYNIDPYQKLSENFQGVIFKNPSGLTTPHNSGTDPTIETHYYLDLNTFDFANFLGFEELIYQSSDNNLLDQFKVIAETIFKHISHSNSYVIELLDIQLDSFDSFSNGRRNILSVVPTKEDVLNTVSGMLRYEPNTPTFISLKNKERKFAIRNIRARILTQDLQPIDTNGLNIITVLLKTIMN